MPNTQSKDRRDNLEPTLTYKEVAALLKCSVRHIQKSVRDGRFPKPIKIGRAARFTMNDIRRVLNGNSFLGLTNQAI